MRKLYLYLASGLGFIGLLTYFISMPTINENALIDIEVETGDEALLEDMYFSGSLANYSSFYTMNGETKSYESLSYLEQLDTPQSANLMFLQKKYPEMINNQLYGREMLEYTLLNSEDYLLSVGFHVKENGYTADPSVTYMYILDKGSGELINDHFTREGVPENDWHSILGVYEEYPVIKILYATENWTNPTNASSETTLRIGEYNVETKNYAEKSLGKEEGWIYLYNVHSQVSMSQKNRILSTVNHETGSEKVSHFMRFEDGVLQPIEHTDRKYFIGENGNLYALANEEDRTFLRQYDFSNEELVDEVELAFDGSIDLRTEYPPVVVELRDEKLYIVQNQMSEQMNEENLKPSLIHILDSQTGEHLLSGKAEYNVDDEVHGITEGVISQFGYQTDY